MAFELDVPGRFIEGASACASSMPFESVCGNGIMEIADDGDKTEGLTVLMRQYSDKPSFEFEEKELKLVTVLKLTVREITGKRLNK